MEEEKRRLFESLLDTCGEQFGHLLDTPLVSRAVHVVAHLLQNLLLNSASADGW